MRHHSVSASARRLRPSILRMALLSALCAVVAPQVVFAQQAAKPVPADPPADQAKDAPVTLDSVVVSGIRASIQSSIAKKREATVVSDVLSSDDIGDLPALSIGEAIETITGAASHREKGGASEISVRGLGPFLSTSTFNGRDATNGSGDRSVNFNQFPSELINTVAIYKTQRADFIEGGIAGIINMETIKPLDYGKRRIQLEGRATYNAYDGKLLDSSGVGWRGTASYLDQFDLGSAGKLGISVGFQGLQGDDPEETFSSSSTYQACNDLITTAANCPSVTSAAVAAGTPYYLIPGSRTYRQMSDTSDQRNSYFAAMQWKPNDAWDVEADYQYSKRNYVEDRSELVFSETLRGVGNRVVGPEGQLISYTGDSSIESTSDYKTRDEEYTGAGFRVAWNPNEAWMLSADLAYSHTVRNENDWATRLRSNGKDINGVVVPGIFGSRQVKYSYDYSGDVPSIVTNPLFDLNRWENFSGVPRVRRDEQHRDHELRAVRFDGAYYPQSEWLTAIKAGARFSKATYTDYDDRVEINYTDAALIKSANIACRTPFPQDDFLSAASGNTISSWATFDPLCLFQAFTGTTDTGPNDDLRSTANNDVTEKISALYLMSDFSSEMFGVPVTGNVGLRWVKTDVSSAGQRSGLNVINNPDGTVSLVSTGDFDLQVINSSNNVFLPSLNAAFEVRDDTLFRVGLYRAMSRPDLSALGAGRSITLENGQSFDNIEDAISSITATGNPSTKPLLAWNADLSLEWYPNKDSMLSAALYYKQFNGGSITTVLDETFIIDGNSVVVPVVQPATTNEKSDLVGLELTASYRFSHLPAPFDGLGVKASYNYADANYKNEDLRLGEQLNPSTGVVTPRIVDPVGIFGLSRNVASGSIYYTLGPVNMQLIYKYRSEYYQKFVGTPAQNRMIEGNDTVDFRVNWRVNKNVLFMLEGSNIFNEPKISYIPITGSFHEYHVYGPRYYLGVRLSY